MSFYQWSASSHEAHMPSPQNAKFQEKREMRSLEDIIFQKSIGALNSLDFYSMSENFEKVMDADENLNVQLRQSPATFGGRCYSIFLGFITSAKSGFLYTIFLKLERATKIAGSKTLKDGMNSYAKVNQIAQNNRYTILAKLDLYNRETLSSLQDFRIPPQTKTILEKS